MKGSQVSIGMKFYDDENKDCWIVDEYTQWETWSCRSLTRDDVVKTYDTQDIMRLFNLSMF